MLSSFGIISCNAFPVNHLHTSYPSTFRSTFRTSNFMCNSQHDFLNASYSTSNMTSWKSYFDEIPSSPVNKYSKNKKVKYFPRTDNQHHYVNVLEDDFCPLVFGLGPAGTGKTLFACEVGIRAFKAKQFDKIVITRPLVSVEHESVGFLPGNMKDKMDPWTRPIIDVLNELLTKEDVQNMIRSGVIEISPLAYMRGRTFKNAWIIADEMQNSSPIQMKMLTTRIGDGSKMVINGDLQQSDFGSYNGLDDIMKRVLNFNNNHDDVSNDKYDHIRIVEMQNSDIQRSPIVAKLMQIYDYNAKDVSPDASQVASPDASRKKNQDAALMPLEHIKNHLSK